MNLNHLRLHSLKRWLSMFLFASGAFAFGVNADGQQDTPPAESSSKGDNLATLYGSVDLSTMPSDQIQAKEFAAELVEQVVYKPLPLPPDWGERSVADRHQWLEDFRASPEGVEFFAEREASEENRFRFPVRIEDDGSFVIYDVRPATYNLFGRQDVEFDGKLFAVELFGQIEVGNVDEVRMPPLPFDVTRLLRSGETAPEFKVRLIDGSGEIALSHLSGKPVLLHFWTAQMPISEAERTALQETYDQLHTSAGLEMVAICVDPELAAAESIIAEQKFPWRQAATDGWQHSVFTDYGIRSVPAFYLIDAQGRIAQTSNGFFEALSVGGATMAEAVAQGLQAENHSESPK